MCVFLQICKPPMALSMPRRQRLKQYCAAHGYKLAKICKDVISGRQDQRPGLQALSLLERSANILIASSSIGSVGRSNTSASCTSASSKMDERNWWRSASQSSSIRRWDALVSILLVFAQMEREATGERTREAIRHLRSRGYHFGKVPYGMRAVTARTILASEYSPRNPKNRKSWRR